jgi:NtrC-family two-component system response regulator AlgB
MQTKSPMRLLVLVPGQASRRAWCEPLRRLGHCVTVAPTEEAALRLAPAHDALIIDADLFVLLPASALALFALPTMAIHFAAAPQIAFDAARRGAFALVDGASPEAAAALAAASSSLPRNVDSDASFSSHSARMREVEATLDLAAKVDAPVLLRGESGTGKSLLAGRLHARSGRRERAFVAVSCPTLSEELMTTELFGHVRGAFTGALRDKPGRVELADGGTVLLDEVGDLPPALQAKLLDFVQYKRFERVGDTHTRFADVRIVAATNRDLEADVASGRFRLDLYYRLSVVDVRIPALRERREDILDLAWFFLQKAAGRRKKPCPRLERDAEAALLAYDWPGNVRQLENELERALTLSGAGHISAACLSERLRGAETASPFVGGDFTVEQVERAHIETVLARARSYEAASLILGIDDSTLWRKRKRYAGSKLPLPSRPAA